MEENTTNISKISLLGIKENISKQPIIPLKETNQNTESKFAKVENYHFLSVNKETAD